MTTMEMEWEVHLTKSGMLHIRTVESCFWETDRKRNGERRAKAKETQMVVYTAHKGNWDFWEKLILQHNLWIHRENPEAIERLIKKSIDDKLESLTRLCTPANAVAET